jgi:hypothetical protein
MQDQDWLTNACDVMVYRGPDDFTFLRSKDRYSGLWYLVAKAMIPYAFRN